MFAGKPRDYQREAPVWSSNIGYYPGLALIRLESCFTWLVSGLTLKHYTRLERLGRD
jgi:hypothetical protein